MLSSLPDIKIVLKAPKKAVATSDPPKTAAELDAKRLVN
jgi:hypothetical protein